MTEESNDIFGDEETATSKTTVKPIVETEIVKEETQPETKPEAKSAKKKKKEKIKPCKLPAEVTIAINSLEKAYGKGSVMQMGGSSFAEIGTLYPTPSIALDIALGLIRQGRNGKKVHGLPSGKIVEVLGPEASGKTTICNHVMAAAQTVGGLVGMIDMENTWDPMYASKLGVKTQDVVISQPDFGEQALDTAETLIGTGKFAVIIVDSIASLVPKAELEGAMGSSHMGLQARLMSQACRKLSPLVNNTGTLLIFTNQIRHKIGVMFGSPETTPGGTAMKYYASIRMDIRKIAQLKDNTGQINGHRGRITIVKNKLAPPYRKCEFDMIHNKGIDKMSSLLEASVEYGLIKQSGSWYSYGDQQLGQGKDKVIDFLHENMPMAELIEDEIYKMVYEDLYPQ